MGTDDANRKVPRGDVNPFTRLEIGVGSVSVDIIPADRWSLEIASGDLAGKWQAVFSAFRKGVFSKSGKDFFPKRGREFPQYLSDFFV